METVIQQRPRKMVSTQEGEERERESAMKGWGMIEMLGW